jgi:hypothetical protein
MDWTDSALLTALQFLAPGFVAAWVLFALTADRKLSDFQRVVQALIFSVFIKVAVSVVEGVCAFFSQWIHLGSWTADVEFAWSVGGGLVFGLLLSWLLATDRLHSLLRKSKVTTQTSRPSVWYSCFCDHPETYVVLQLADDRRIQGWPSEWPSIPGEGHIRLDRAVWLVVEGRNQQEVPMPEGNFIMINSAEIRWIEFQPKPIQLPAADMRDCTNEKQSTASAFSAA